MVRLTNAKRWLEGKHQEQLIRTPRFPVPEILTLKEYLKNKPENLLSPSFLLPELPNCKRPCQAKPLKHEKELGDPRCSIYGRPGLCPALPLTVVPIKNKDLGMSVALLGISPGHLEMVSFPPQVYLRLPKHMGQSAIEQTLWNHAKLIFSFWSCVFQVFWSRWQNVSNFHIMTRCLALWAGNNGHLAEALPSSALLLWHCEAESQGVPLRLDSCVW